MSLETVVEDIRNQARERAEEIHEEAEERAERIIEEAEHDAADIIAEAEREAARDIERERDQKLSSATLEAKQERLEARRDVLESVRADVEDRIAAIDGEQRARLTSALIDAAAPEFEDTTDVAVYGRAADADLIQGILEDYDFEYAGEYDCLGGVILESEALRLRVNHTFDSILEDVWDVELQAISNQLFEQ